MGNRERDRAETETKTKTEKEKEKKKEKEKEKEMGARPSSSPVACFRSGLLAVLKHTHGIKVRGDNTVRHETC